jgi:hypothetical protein
LAVALTRTLALDGRIPPKLHRDGPDDPDSWSSRASFIRLEKVTPWLVERAK